MGNKLKLEESLSALMDNEADDLELRRILKELPEDHALKQKWECYHLISASLKQEVHEKPSVDLLGAIHLELESEPAYSAEQFEAPKKSSKSMMSLLGQGAIAASVALAVLVTVGSFNTEETALEVAATADTTDNLPELNGNFTDSEFSRTVSYDGSMDEAARDRLTQAVYQVFENTAVGTQQQDALDR